MPALEIGEVRNLIDAQKGVPFMDSRPLFPGIQEKFPFTQGKVRQTYDLGDGNLLMIATDRISAYDVVMREGIPGKGIILTGMSHHTMDLTSVITPNHFKTDNVDDFPPPFRGVDKLRGRTMLVEKLDMALIEAVVRGYLVGSGWADYKKSGAVCGHVLPPGMVEAQKIETPIFTPATKAQDGHDINIDYGTMSGMLGEQFPDMTDLAEVIRDYSIDLYGTAADYMIVRGVILADTKFEFGISRDGLVIVKLGDESFTPDSSRFWPADQYQPGGPQPSFDKQYVRDYLDSTGWNHDPPSPRLPEEVVGRTQEKYLEAYERIVG